MVYNIGGASTQLGAVLPHTNVDMVVFARNIISIYLFVYLYVPSYNKVYTPKVSLANVRLLLCIVFPIFRIVGITVLYRCLILGAVWARMYDIIRLYAASLVYVCMSA